MREFDGIEMTYLDGAEYPKDQSLNHNKARRADTECKVDTYVFANIGIHAFLPVHLGPLLQPDAAT
jgi:hypothetical protein